MLTFLRFSFIGTLGFIIDATVFFLSVNLLALNWAESRVLAFLMAVGATWLGNRRVTFRSSAPPKTEVLRYFAVQSGGCLVNYLSFVGFAAAFGTGRWLIAPYLVGTAAGMIFNYSLSRYFVFLPNEQ